MKLISKTNRNFTIIILVILPISCALLFFSLKYFSSIEIDEKLRVDEMRIIEQLKQNPTFISIAPIIDVRQIDENNQIAQGIQDVVAYDPIEKEDEPYRELVSVKKINGNWYLIKIRHSIIEGKDYLIAIGFTMLAILLLIFILLLLLNNRLSLKLWKPFYTNLNRLKSFSITENKKLELEDSNINEFQDLKSSLLLLTDQLKKDYSLLKEFTENASHELQTPLAVISINLEEILQDDLSEENYKKLYSSYQTVQRLSKLNERLLLLAKLDNNQFTEVSEVDFNVLLAEKTEELNPLFNERKLTVNLDSTGKFTASLDPLLANILVVNLLSNAIKHSVPNSRIDIEVSDRSIQISNAADSIIDEKLVFVRFKKGNDASNSTGLGLSIVKRIVEVSNLEIQVSSTQANFSVSIAKKHIS